MLRMLSRHLDRCDTLLHLGMGGTWSAAHRTKAHLCQGVTLCSSLLLLLLLLLLLQLLVLLLVKDPLLVNDWILALTFLSKFGGIKLLNRSSIWG